jgi:PAS domain S-box-containing protein
MLKPRVLHLDDEKDFLVLFSMTFGDVFDIRSTVNGNEAIQLLKTETFDAVITDYEMGDFNGLELLSFVKSSIPGVPVIFYTGQGNEEIAREAFISGASDYYIKDISEFAHKEKIINSITQAIEKRKAEKALKESEKKYKQIFDESLELYILIDLNFNILDVNKTYLDIMKQNKDNLIGKNLLDTVTEESGILFRRMLNNEVPEEETEHEIIQFITPDGIRTILTRKNAVLFKNDEGETESILLSGIDLTELRITQDALKSSEELLRAITHGATIAIAILDQDGKITYWNKSAEEMFGYTSSESIGQLFYKKTLPKRYHSPYRLDFESFRKTEQKVFTGKTITLTAENRQGEEFPVKLSFRSVKIEGTWHAVGVIRDISRQKKAEDALRDSENRYRNLIESIKDAVYTISPDGKFLSVNPAFEMITGWKTDEIVGTMFTDFVHEDDKEFALQAFKSTLQGESYPYGEFRVKLNNGNYITAEVKLAPLVKNGRITGAVGIGQDITIRKRMEQELINKNIELNDFAHTISHELKNDLTTVYGYLEIMQKNPELLDTYCKKAMSKTLHLVDFVDNLLRLSRAGKVIDQKQNIDLQKLIRVIHENEVKDAISSELTINGEVSSLSGDPERFTQVFTNVIRNSIRYRDEDKGVLKIDISIKDENTFSHLVFRDNGRGIHPDVLPHIFKPGFTSDRNKGTGFGLAIVQKIVEAHGGQVWAESKGLNEGTSIHIRLPKQEKMLFDV